MADLARVAVVGGGLAGCAAALALAEQGCAVTLYEKRPTLGGRASSYTASGWDKPLDNAQHVLLGCCVNQLDLYRRLGVLDQIDWHDTVPLIGPTGERGSFAAWPLPPPLHLAPTLGLLPELRLADRLILAAAFGRLLLAGRRLERLDRRTFADWLRPTDSPALAGFWRLMIASVLNAEPGEVSARYGAFFFLDGLMRHRDAFRLGVPRVALSELHEVAMRPALAAAGVEPRQTAGRLWLEHGRVAGVGGERFDATLVAVHWRQLGGVLPHGLAEAVAGAAPSRLEAVPLLGVHLGFDEPVLDQPVVGFIGHDVDWVMTFDGGRHLSVVASAARDWRGLSDEQRVDRALTALRRIWPGLPRPTRSASCLEQRATLLPAPGSDRWRPGPRTRLPGCYLAGCWTATGWPSTMESAVRSGYLAAEALLADLGAPATIAVPDLPRAGLMRLFRSA